MNSYHAVVMASSPARWIDEQDGYTHANTLPFLSYVGLHEPAVVNDVPLVVTSETDYYYENGEWTHAGGYPSHICYWANDSVGNLYCCVRRVGAVDLYEVIEPYSADITLVGTITIPNLDANSRFGIYLDDEDRWHVAWTTGSGGNRAIWYVASDDWGLTTSPIVKLVGSDGAADDYGNLNALTLSGKDGHLFILTSIATSTSRKEWIPPTLAHDGYWATYYHRTQQFILLSSHDHGATWGTQSLIDMDSDTDPDYEDAQEFILRSDPGYVLPLCVGDTGIFYAYVFTFINRDKETFRVLRIGHIADYTAPSGGAEQELSWGAADGSGDVYITHAGTRWVEGNGLSAIVWIREVGVEYTYLLVADDEAPNARLVQICGGYEHGRTPTFVDWVARGYSFWW